MSRSVMALTVATLACGSASAYFWQELREERQQTTTLQARVAELERTSSSAPSMPATPEPVSAAAELSPQQPPAQTAPKLSGAPAPGAVLASPAPAAMFSAIGTSMRGGAVDPEMRRRIMENHEQQSRMLKDPEYRELLRSQQKIALQRMYGDLDPLLGLSKEESDRLLDVLAEHSIRAMEQRPMLPLMDGAQPDQNALREQQRFYEERRRKNEAEIAAALGPKYQQWQEYQNNGWSRSQVMRLRQTLSGTNEPLRQDQVRPLVEAMAREQKQMNVGFRSQVSQSRPMDAQTQLRLAEEWLERSAQSQQRIRDAVVGLLTPTQFEQLQQQHEQELKMQELHVKHQRARAEAQARGEIPSDPAAVGALESVITYAD